MLTIRLMRIGKKNRPYYRIVVQEKRSKKDGACIESLGFFDPLKKGESLRLNLERAKLWIARGAQASDTVRSLIKRVGARPAA